MDERSFPLLGFDDCTQSRLRNDGLHDPKAHCAGEFAAVIEHLIAGYSEGLCFIDV